MMNSIIQEDFDTLEKSYSQVLNELKGKSVLITGATGMITTYLSFFLLYLAERYSIKLYLQVRNVDKAKSIYSDYLGKEYLKLLAFNVEKDEMPVETIDYLIHAASAASTKAFIEKPVEVIGPNAVGTWNLLNWCRNNQVKKFLLLSSNSIYGEGGVEKAVLTEEDYGIVNPLNDRASYIVSKRMAEQMCRAFNKQYGVPTSIIRICHCYGPTFDVEHDTRIIPRMIKRIIEGNDLEIFSDPYSKIQYTYIADMISAIIVTMINGEQGEAYNAGGDELITIEDAIKWMLKADIKKKSQLVIKEQDDSYQFAKGKGVNFLMLANDKIKKIGWKQIYSNELGFERTVRKYLEELN